MDEVKSLLDSVLQRCEQIASYDPLNRNLFALPIRVPQRAERPSLRSVEVESNAVDSWSILPDRIKYLGSLPPSWQADENVTECLGCGQQFAFLRRKHHCRACGRVFCSGCTSNRIKLTFNSEQGSRVCAECYEIIPEVYRLKIDVVHNSKELSSSLKSASSQDDKLEKSVKFIDGIGPAKIKEITIDDVDEKNIELQPTTTGDQNDVGAKNENWTIEAKVVGTEPDGSPIGESLTSKMKDGGVVFQLRSSIYCKARISTLSCCTNQRCLSVCTMGLCKVASDELFFSFEFGYITRIGPIIKWLLNLIENYYEDAGDGKRYSINMCVDIPPETPCPLGNVAAFLFTKPTKQCLSNLALPNNAYLIAIPICKEEVGLAKCLPTRLLIQMGSEYNVFPFPVVLPIRRKALPTFADHTVLTMLCDFRNFLFSMPIIDSMRVSVEPPNTIRMTISQLAMPAMVEALRTQYCPRTRRIADMVTLACGIGPADTGSYVNYAYRDTSRFTEDPAEYRGTNMLFVVFLSSPSLRHRSFNCRRVDDGLLFHFTKRQVEVIAGYLTTGKEKNILLMDGNEKQTLVITWTKGSKARPASFRSPIDGKCLDDFPTHRMVDPLVEKPKFSINWTTIVVLRGLLFRDFKRTYERLMRIALEFVACLRVECISKPIALRIFCSRDEMGYLTNCEDPGDKLTKEDLGCALLPILNDLASENAVYELHFHAEYF